ncbi:MAG: V-type ATP synthase subunit D [Planctomycetes bacterium]|nr:V-type ATP synthase subunit D [Planctomycetota bacterium]
MAKIKLSKTELKTQRDSLKRFTRFLPTLQLKKQQLQAEVMKLHEEIKLHSKKVEEDKKAINEWIGLYNTSDKALIEENVIVEDIKLSTKCIAGVDLPVLDEVIFKDRHVNLFESALWVDEGMDYLEKIIIAELTTQVLQEQKSRLEAELRVTTQRVNLFEKIKIPECQENIRVIQIAMGDQQTAAVGRGKMAKKKLASRDKPA